MSVPSNEVLLGDPIIPINQSIYEGDTVQRAPLGTRLKLSDRTYYYALSATTAAGGTVLCGTQPVASHQSGILLIASTSVGASIISGTSSASVAANFYAEGYFSEAAGTGAGEVYKIKGHPVGTAAIPITLYDDLNVTITSGTTYALIPSPYKNVLVASQNLGIPAGVAVAAVTSGSYFWLQTYGPGAPNHEAASAAGAALRLGTTGGLVATFNSTTNDATTVSALVIAKNMGLAATAGQQNPAFLLIRP